MSRYISDNELLSAYIDGELSTEEINDLEQRLVNSHDLQKKLLELKKLKELTGSSIRKLPESPYFDTRFFAELNSAKPAGKGIRKYIPVFGFSLLAVILMLVLKLNPDMLTNIVEEQKTNIASFYKENLKPLLYAANLTNEDIFNFAFSNRIPLDNNENQVLQLGYDESGKEFFEIKNVASLNPVENNLEKFVQALNLNEKQRKQIDSILDSYADDLQTQILVNEKNTVAVNPNIWNYNKAIAAELLAFAESTNKNEFRKMIPASYTFPAKGELRQYVSEVKTARDNEYIFFTPDSVFSEVYEFDKGKFRVEVQKMRKELDKELKNLDSELKHMNIQLNFDSTFSKHKKSRVDNQYRIFVDSNSFRVVLPVVPSPNIKLPMLDSLDIYLDELAENMKTFSFDIEISEHPKTEVYNFRFKDSLKTYDLNIPENFNMQDFDSLFQNKNYNFDSLKLPMMNYYYNTDSLTSQLRFFMNDSLNFFNHEEFRKEMEELEKEMRHFREEMNELRKDINKDKKKTTIKKPIDT